MHLVENLTKDVVSLQTAGRTWLWEVIYRRVFLKICWGCIQYRRGGGWHMPLPRRDLKN